MQPFGVLDRYIGKTIFTTIMMTLFMLVSLSGIIKFVDQLKKAGQGSYDALGAGMYTLLSVPKDVQIFFPMAALLGALLGLGMLAQRSELVVMQASGFTRMQVALTHTMTPDDIAVTLSTDAGRFQSRWFIRENGTLLESSRGLSGIDEIKQLFGAKTLTIDTGTESAAGKLTFNIDGLAKPIAPLRDACHWAGE